MVASHSKDSSQPQPNTLTNFHILIIGAGIGGLSLAIGLAQASHRVTVIERKSSPDTPILSSGGGLNLTANAIRCLEAIGLGERLGLIADRVTRIDVKRYATGESIAVTETTRPHVMLHRQDLQIALNERAIEVGVEVVFGRRVESMKVELGSPVIHFQDGTELAADVVVGADGINSQTRKLLFPNQKTTPSLTANCVFLLDIPSTTMDCSNLTKPLCNSPPYQIWLGPGRCIVAWYMSARETYHLQLCEHQYGHGEAYGSRPEKEHEGFVLRFENMELLRQRWADFDPSVRTILGAAQSCVKWRIATVPALPAWSGHDGKVILLGDAAHAFPPFAGQGAAMAIEDASCLATLFENTRGVEDVKEIGRVFEDIRRPRIEKIDQIVQANTKMFSLGDGLEQKERDGRLRAGPAKREKMMSDNLEGEAEWGQGVGKVVGREGLELEDYDAVGEARKGWEARRSNL